MRLSDALPCLRAAACGLALAAGALCPAGLFAADVVPDPPEAYYHRNLGLLNVLVARITYSDDNWGDWDREYNRNTRQSKLDWLLSESYGRTRCKIVGQVEARIDSPRPSGRSQTGEWQAIQEAMQREGIDVPIDRYWIQMTGGRGMEAFGSQLWADDATGILRHELMHTFGLHHNNGIGGTLHAGTKIWFGWLRDEDPNGFGFRWHDGGTAEYVLYAEDDTTPVPGGLRAVRLPLSSGVPGDAGEKSYSGTSLPPVTISYFKHRRFKDADNVYRDFDGVMLYKGEGADDATTQLQGPGLDGPVDITDTHEGTREDIPTRPETTLQPGESYTMVQGEVSSLVEVLERIPAQGGKPPAVRVRISTTTPAGYVNPRVRISSLTRDDRGTPEWQDDRLHFIFVHQGLNAFSLRSTTGVGKTIDGARRDGATFPVTDFYNGASTFFGAYRIGPDLEGLGFGVDHSKINVSRGDGWLATFVPVPASGQELPTRAVSLKNLDGWFWDLTPAAGTGPVDGDGETLFPGLDLGRDFFFLLTDDGQG